MHMVNNMNFVKGIGVGLVVGSAIGMVMAPPKKNEKTTLGRAVRAMGTVIDSISDSIGI